MHIVRATEHHPAAAAAAAADLINQITHAPTFNITY